MIAVLTPCTAPHSSSAETSRPQISVPGSNLRLLRRYYYGNRNDIQRAGVQNILNSVMKELAWNPDRKFSYVEQAFFQVRRGRRSYVLPGAQGERIRITRGA